jgi:hypothetical protein
MTVKKTVSAAPSRRVRRAPWYRYSRFWFALALGFFVISTLVAVIQIQSPHDPYARLKISSLDWWFRPSEPHRKRNFQTIRADLHAVAVSNDGKQVWVGGNSGLIATSTDSGVTWTNEPIAAAPATETTATTTASPTAN